MFSSMRTALAILVTASVISTLTLTGMSPASAAPVHVGAAQPLDTSMEAEPSEGQEETEPVAPVSADEQVIELEGVEEEALLPEDRPMGHDNDSDDSSGTATRQSDSGTRETKAQDPSAEPLEGAEAPTSTESAATKEESSGSEEPGSEAPAESQNATSEELESATPVDPESSAAVEHSSVPEESESVASGESQSGGPEDTESAVPTESALTGIEGDLAETAFPEGEGDLAALTAPVDSIDFIAAGVTWDPETAENILEVSVRVRESDDWTDWHDLEIHAEVSKSERVSERRGTEPLLTSGADAVQARVVTESGNAPSGLEVTLIDPGESPTDGKLAPASPADPQLEELEADAEAADQASVSNGDGDQSATLTSTRVNGAPAAAGTAVPMTTRADDVLKPAIVTRAQWGANESWASDSPQSSELKAMYIHHTAGTNNYSRAEAYQQIRSIYSYHARTLNWGDIGYQFLVDRYGTVFEGRRGALDSLPLGAQAGGFNTDTIGVSAMGDFDTAQPPAVMVEALKKVLAWKAYKHGVNATGLTTLMSRGSSSSSARYEYGREVRVSSILGHRDTNHTACPGRYLYPKLPSIRSEVAQRVNAAIEDHGPGDEERDTVWSVSNVYVLSRPSPSSSPLALIARGEQLRVLSTSDGWSRVESPVGTGWVPSSHVSSSDPGLGLVIAEKHTVSNVYLRGGVGMHTPHRELLRRDVSVQVIRQVDDWSYVSSSEGNGWVPDSHLESRVWSVSNVYVLSRPSSTSEPVGLIGPAEKMQLLSTSDGWSRVESPVGTGWVPSSHVSDSDPGVGASIGTRYTVSNVYLRAGAGAHTQYRELVGPNQPVQVLRDNGDWSYVSSSKGNGWVPDSHLESSDWSLSNVYVLSRPSSTSNALALLGRGEQLQVLNTSNGWSRVDSPVGTGWVPSSHVSSSYPGVGESIGTRYTLSNVYLRAGAGAHTLHRELVGPNQSVQVLHYNGGWSYVTSSQGTGWVPNTHISSW